MRYFRLHPLARVISIGMLAFATTSAYATSYSWTGTAGDNLWSTATNWNTSTVPVSANNTSLSFTLGSGVPNLATLNNDIGGAFTLNSLNLSSLYSGSSRFNLDGGGLTFAGTSASVNFSGSYSDFVTYINQAVQLNTDLTMNGGSAGAGSQLYFFSGIHGSGGLVINSGDILFQGGGLYDYSGDTTIASGAWLDVSAGGTGNQLSSNSRYIVNGVLNLAGGNNVIGSLEGSGQLRFEGGDLTVGALNTSTTFSGSVYYGSQVGGLTKIGTGTLTLTGHLAPPNGITISNGALQIGNGGTSGSVGGHITDNATLIFNRSDATSHAGTINGSGSLVKKGAGTLTLTGTNTYTGGTTISAGTLQIGNGGTTGSIVGDISDNGSLVFNRSDGISYAGAITGSGSVRLAAGVNSFTGNLTGYSGTMTVDGSTLSIADGNTLTLGGNYNQTANGTLQLGASSSSSFGKLSVAGSASFAPDSKIDVNVASINTLAPGETLAGVISAGTLNASTFTLSDNSTLFNFKAATNGNNVDLHVIKAAKIVDSVIRTGLTPGIGAAKVLDVISSNINNTGDMATVVTALGKLNGDHAISQAVAQTLPLLVSGTSRVTKGLLHATNRVIDARQSSLMGLSSGDGFLTDKHLWLKPVGSWTQQGKRNGVSGYTADSYGLVGGIDGDLNENTNLGFALSYMNNHVNGTGTASTNSATINAYQAIVYGSHNLQNMPNVELNWQADVGLNKNDGSRNIAFGGLSRTANANYDSYTGHIGVGAGHHFQLNDHTTIMPSIRADYAYIKDNHYTESGAGALNLDVNSNSSQELITMAQSTIDHSLNDKTSLTADLGVGYDFINDRTSLTASYVGGGTAFTTRGIDPSPWLARAGAGVHYALSDTSEFTARYDVEGRRSFINQTASVKFRWLF